MSDAPAKTQKKGGCLKRLAIVGGVGMSAVVLSVFVGWAWLRSEAGERFLVRQIESIGQKSFQSGTFTIGNLDTDLWGNIRLDDIVIADDAGTPVVSVPTVTAEMSLLPLLWDQRLQLRRVTIFQPNVRLLTTDEGINLFQMLAPSDPNKPRANNLMPIDLTIDQLQMRQGEFTLDGAGLVDLSLDSRLVYTNDVLTVQPIDLTGEWVGEVANGPLEVNGGIALDWDADRLDLTQLRLATLDSRIAATGAIHDLSTETRLDIDGHVGVLDVARLDPILFNEAGLQGRWTGDVHVGGTPQLLDITAVLDDAKGTAGGLDAAVAVNLGGDELQWDLEGTLRAFELDALLKPITDVIRLNGDVTVSGRGDTFPDGMVIEGHVDGGEQVIYTTFKLDQLIGDFRIENGVVNLSDVHLVNPYLDVMGNGTIDIVNGPMDLRVGGAVMPAGLASMELPGLSGRGRADVRITGNVLAEEIDFDLRGNARVDDFGYLQLVDIETLTSGIRGNVRADYVDLDLDLAALQTTSSGVIIERVDAPDLDVRYRFDGHIFASSEALAVDTVRYPDVFTVDDATGTFDFTMPPSGQYQADLDLVLGEHDLLGYTGTTGLAEVSVDPQTAAFDIWFQDGFRTLARTIGTYDLEAGRVELVGLEAAPIPGGTWEANGPLEFSVAEGGIADARIDIVSTYGRITAIGDLATTGDVDGRVGIHNLDMSYVARLVPAIEQDLAGELDVRATLVGPASEVAIDAYVRGDVAIDGRVPLSMDVNLFADDGVATLDAILLAGSEPLAAVEGDVPVILNLAAPDLDTDGYLDVEGFIEPGAMSRFSEVFGVEVPAGRISGVFEANGEVIDPALMVRGVMETPLPNLANDGRVELYVDRRLGDLSAWAMALEGFSPVAEVDGTATTDLSEVFSWALGQTEEEPDWTDYDQFVDKMDVTLRTDDLPVDVLVSAAQIDADVDGYLRGTAHIQGSASQPTATTDIRWVQGAMGPLQLGETFLTVEPEGDTYVLDGQLAFQDGGQFTIGGEIPVAIDLRNEVEQWSDGPIDVQLTGDSIPVEALTVWIPDASQGTGTVEIEGTVGGTLLEPDPQVQIALVDGGMSYGPTGVLYRNANGTVNINRQRVVLSDFTVETDARCGLIALASDLSDSRINASATATLEGWFPTSVNGEITMQNAWLSALSNMQIQTSGDLSVSGDYPDLSVTGDIRVNDALVVQDLASFLTVAPLDLDDRIRVVRSEQPEEEDKTEELAPEPGLMEMIDIALDVSLGRQVRVQVAFPFLDDLGSIGASLTRADVQARMGGDVDFEMQNGQMALYGPIEVLDGTMRVLQTSFNIDSGTATFQGDPFNPYLDLGASTQVGTANIDLTVSGTALEPDIAFDSQEYPDQSQILAMLITGRELDTLNSDQGSAATEALVGLLLSSVLSGARLGSVSYDPDGTVRVGIPVFSTVYLETAFDTQPNIGDNQLEVQAEWAIASKLVFEATIGTQFNYADLFWETRF